MTPVGIRSTDTQERTSIATRGIERDRKHPPVRDPRPSGRPLASPGWHDLTQTPASHREGAPHVDRPRLNVKSFSSKTDLSNQPAPHPGATLRRDKSTKLSLEEQDKILSTSTFGAHARGVNIVVDASTGGRTAGRAAKGAVAGGILGLGVGAVAGSFLGSTLAGALVGAALGAVVGGLVGGLIGEYRFTQTIDTNVPLGGSTSPYVDPRPNDDSKPFYWTDAEHKTYGNKFEDHPSRNAPASGTTNWDATLSITHVVGKTVSVLESLKYGFSIDSASAVTTRAPASTTSVGTHISTLAGSFPDWTFRRES